MKEIIKGVKVRRKYMRKVRNVESEEEYNFWSKNYESEAKHS